MTKRPRPAQSRPAATLTPDLLAAALRAQGDGVAVLSLGARGGRIVFANPSLAKLTRTTPSELLGRPHASLHSDRRELERLARWLKTAAPGDILRGEGHLLRGDGSVFVSSWTFSVLRNARGRATHLIATYRDTTERRRRQDELVHTQRLEAVGRLAGGVAHDFNNLLSVINGYCEILATQVAAQPPLLRQVSEVHRAGLRAAALTRQLLAFGRQQPMDTRVINLNRLVHDHVEILARLVGTAGRLETNLTDPLANVRADPTQFQQVLLNLVLNARDALRDRGVITIATSHREVKPGQNRRATDMSPGRYVCLSVTDNGTGMDAEAQKHLFEPFFTTKPEGKGTGLGLALVYGVVQQSGGYITVRSALLAGSTFEILLPAVPEPEAHPGQEDSLPPLPTTGGHESLLLIEPDEVVRKMVAGMLTTDGYRVVAAADLKEAADGIRGDPQPFDLLIAGCTAQARPLVRQLLARNPRLRLLRVTAEESSRPLTWLPTHRQAAMRKPFALSEVLRLARELLDAKG